MKRLITAGLFVWAVVSCSNAVPTAIATSGAQVTVSPAETLQVLTSSVPTIQTPESTVPDPADVLDPQGSPVQEWRGIPIMPAATAGQEFAVNNAYGFKVKASARDVEAFYVERLTELGWSQPFDNPFDENGGTMTFRNEGSSLSITVTASGDSVMVLLVMAFA